MVHRTLNVSEKLSINIVKAYCILHNLVRTRDGYKFEDTLSIEGLETIANNNSDEEICAIEIRAHFADYFVSTSVAVPWQYDKI